MKPTMLFLTTGDSHAHHLAVALMTLRKYYDGNIEVWAFPESREHSRALAYDPRIGAEFINYDNPVYRGKNEQEVCKIDIIRKHKSNNPIVYLDADLIFQKSPEYIAPHADGRPDFVGVVFCDWTMRVGVARNRVENLRGIEGIDQECVSKALRASELSYNSGVFASSPRSPVLDTWFDWTMKAKDIFIAGETTLHAVAQKHSISVAGGMWNSSPKHKAEDLPDRDVCIWHGHGDSFCRPQKTKKGFELWKPLFNQVLYSNIGKIQEWADQIPNKYFQAIRTQL